MTNNGKNNNVQEQSMDFLKMLIAAAPHASKFTGKDYTPQLKEIAALIKANRLFEAYGRMVAIKEHFDAVNKTVQAETAKVLKDMNQKLSLLKKKQEALASGQTPASPSNDD